MANDIMTIDVPRGPATPDAAQTDPMPVLAPDEQVLADTLLRQMPVAMPVNLHRAYYSTFSKMLRNPSLARRRDPGLQRQMRNDPDIEGPIQNLKTSIVGSDWHIELARGRASERIADGVRDIIEEIPQFSDMCGQLLEAVWYGPAAVNIIWNRNRRGQIGISGWLPVHSDTLAVTTTGDIGLRVGMKYAENNPSGAIAVGVDSWVHPLTPEERACFLLHTFQRRGGDFDEAHEVAYAYLGRGMRDVCWYLWLLKQTGIQNWSSYLERYGMGIRKGYYPSGNQEARQAIESILANLIGDVSIAIPRQPNAQAGTKDDYDVEIMEAGASKARVFLEFIDWASVNMKELIIGQSSTTEKGGSGMGLGVSTQHAKTFNRHQRYIARGLEETIQRQLIVPLVDMNWGPQEHYPTFRYAIADPEVGIFMDAVKAAIDMGAEVSEDDVVQRLGLAKPRPGQRVLSLDTINAAFGPAGGGPLGGKAVNAHSGSKHASNGHPVRTPGERDSFDRESVRGAFDSVLASLDEGAE